MPTSNFACTHLTAECHHGAPVLILLVVLRLLSSRWQSSNRSTPQLPSNSLLHLLRLALQPWGSELPFHLPVVVRKQPWEQISLPLIPKHTNIGNRLTAILAVPHRHPQTSILVAWPGVLIADMAKYTMFPFQVELLWPEKTRYVTSLT